MTQIGDIILSVLEQREEVIEVEDFYNVAQDCERALVEAIARELNTLQGMEITIDVYCKPSCKICYL